MTFTPLGANLPTVTIRQSAVDAIHAELRKDTRSLRRLLETGGPLIGSAVDQRTILRAAGPGPTTVRRRNQLIFDWLVDLVEPAAPDAVLGMWHSHPARENARLSSNDLACFQRLRTGMHRPLQDFAAILAVPTRAGEHELRAWLTGPIVTRPARLVITPDPRPMRSGRQRAAGRHERPRMLVAKASFTTRDGGHLVRVERGDRVVADHELVKQYPQHFATA